MKIDARTPAGNAYAIMGFVQKFLRDAGRGDEVDAVIKQMKSSDYDNLCNVAEKATKGIIRIINRNGEEDDA